MTYYEILEVSENASDEVIRMAYKALVKKYHPDVYDGDSKQAEERMKQINIAFEVLSDEQKRKQYDDFLKSEEKNKPNEQFKTKTPKQKDKSFNYPSTTKSALIIGILLVFSYMQAWHPYAESEWYDYSGLLGLIDFCFVTFLMMIVPILVGNIKKDISQRWINKLCLINSIVLFIISTLLAVTEITSQILISWITSVAYFFINKHILLQIKQHRKNKKRTIAMILLISILLITIIIAGMTTVGKKVNPPINHNYKYYTDIAGNVYDLNGYGECVILRTITAENEFTANFIFERMSSKNFQEENIILIMDEYGADQGGGMGRLIQQGDLVEEVDAWCFDRNREAGDIAIIENAYGYSICYIAAVFSE